jgi:uncharacterized protein
VTCWPRSVGSWEAAAERRPAGCRLVILRIGIVLGPDGGALSKMLPVFRMGFGGPLGNGRQWMSWIHRHDLCRLIAAPWRMRPYAGVYNAVAPQPVTMAAFTRSWGAPWVGPTCCRCLGPLLQVLLGDGAKVVLEGQRVLPTRLQALAFPFQYPELSAALAAATSPGRR